MWAFFILIVFYGNRIMYQRKVDVDVLNVVKSVLADVSNAEQNTTIVSGLEECRAYLIATQYDYRFGKKLHAHLREMPTKYSDLLMRTPHRILVKDACCANYGAISFRNFPGANSIKKLKV